MFSEQYLALTEEIYKALHFEDENTFTNGGKDPSELQELIAKSEEEPLSFLELAGLARSIGSIESLEGLIRDKYRSKGGEVNYIAPTFQTNNCMDVCGECGWNRFQETERVFLKPEQFEQQLVTLREFGFKVIEISNGTVTKLLEWPSLKEYMEMVEKHIDPSKGEGFGICSPVFDQEVFEKLYPDIAQFWVQWMETYDLPSYFSVHNFTSLIPERNQKYSKAKFTARLDSYDTVMQLGGDVMLGVQYGLNGNDPAFDTLMTIAHARYLEERYGRTPLAFGTVKNNAVKSNSSKYSDNFRHDFSDEEYRAQLATYKLAMPSIGRWLNTRVPFSLIKEAIVDGDCYTGECSSMVPGAREGLTNYSNEQAGQFTVFELEKQAWEKQLGKIGLRVDYAWMNK